MDNVPFPNYNIGTAQNTLIRGPRNQNDVVRPPGQNMPGQAFQSGSSLYGSQMQPGQGIQNQMGRGLTNPQMHGGNIGPGPALPNPPVQNYYSQPGMNQANIPNQNPYMSGHFRANPANNPMQNPQYGNYQANHPQGNLSPPFNPQFGANQPNPSYRNQPMPDPQMVNPPNYNQPMAGPQNQGFNAQPNSQVNPVNQYQPQMSVFQKTEPCSPDKAVLIRNYGLDIFIKHQKNLTEIFYNGSESHWVLKGTNNIQVQEALLFLREKINEVRPNITWCWINDFGAEVPYTEIQSNTIEASYLKGIDASINSNGSTYRIKFGKQSHIQQLANSNITRTVRRLDGVDRVNIAMQGDVPWFWQDDDGQFKPYTAEASRQIEQAYRSRAENQVALVQGSNQKAYLMNFTTMKQLNEKSNYERSIKRASPN